MLMYKGLRLRQAPRPEEGKKFNGQAVAKHASMNGRKKNGGKGIKTEEDLYAFAAWQMKLLNERGGMPEVWETDKLIRSIKLDIRVGNMSIFEELEVEPLLLESTHPDDTAEAQRRGLTMTEYATSTSGPARMAGIEMQEFLAPKIEPSAAVGDALEVSAPAQNADDNTEGSVNEEAICVESDTKSEEEIRAAKAVMLEAEATIRRAEERRVARRAEKAAEDER